MSEGRYPILVEKLTREQALVIACECGWERTITADEIRNEENYGCERCGGSAAYKYAPADKCPNCDALGFYHRALDYCCSRPCQLQYEYAKALRGAA